MPRDDTDPVEAATDDSDLYGITSWEERSLLDRIAAGIYRLAVRTGQVVLVAVALLILVGIGGLALLLDPPIGVLTALSILPALALASFSCMVG